MFITKKALQERIAKAVNEKEKEMYMYERFGRIEQRIDKIGEAVYKLERMHEDQGFSPDPEATCNPIGYVKE